MRDQPTEFDDRPRDPAFDDTRISSDEADDLPVSPPDGQPRSGEYLGGDAEPVEETIDQRIMQEEPDPDSAYGAPDNESGLDDRDDRLGGDDPDAIPAESDVLGGGDGELDSTGEPLPDGIDIAAGGDDLEAVATAGDADSIDEELEMPSHGDALSPEESAMHVEDL
ncbi:hypothetical protein [Mobilicoccus sp.]|uniref:hypothetical protein n=1 Tax=Mobilicoccus sp. TaxID=2034349 RepID=UPI0028AD758D|nr:hypothetical protein [Mobilicoccus sp.]